MHDIIIESHPCASYMENVQVLEKEAVVLSAHALKVARTPQNPVINNNCVVCMQQHQCVGHIMIMVFHCVTDSRAP